LKHKLWILNGVLVAVVVYAGVAFRKEWRAARTREKAVLAVKVKAAPAPAFTPLPAPPAVTASSYAQIAMRTLFDPSRNPNVVVEVPPPPPPPVMPALPLCYGVMNLGDGTAAILSETDKSPHQYLHPGGTIGQFKLVDVNTDEITLEWNGQQIHKPLIEMAAAPPAPSQGQTQGPADNTPPPPPQPVKAGPGEDTGRGFRSCSMADGLADGAEAEGYRKKVYSTPFGKSCRWEPIQ
jgi:hypothetical protein